MDIKEVKKFTQNLNILYVEDDLDIIEHVTPILQDLFSSVEVCHDGQKGLDTYNSYFKTFNKYYDIVLTDIEMPHINGIELSKQLFTINPSQHIIVISAYNDKEKLQELLSLGIDDFLHKPVESESFFKTFLKSAKKVNEQLNIKEELSFTQETNQNLETLLDIVNQVAIISKTDLEGKITFVNDLFCNVSQYKKDEILGQDHSIVKHSDMPEAIYKHIWEDIKAGKVWRGKLKNKTKEGESFFANANIFPIFDNHNEISEYIAILFLTTEEEVKNREFKKKVLNQYQESKRNDFKSRKMIDDLERELKKFKNYEQLAFSLQLEKDNHIKCQNQLMATLQNYTQLKKKYDKYVDEVKSKISGIVGENKTAGTEEEGLTNISESKTMPPNKKKLEVHRLKESINRLSKELQDLENGEN